MSWCEYCQRCDCCEVLVCGGTLFHGGGGELYCWLCFLAIVLTP